MPSNKNTKVRSKLSSTSQVSSHPENRFPQASLSQAPLPIDTPRSKDMAVQDKRANSQRLSSRAARDAGRSQYSNRTQSKYSGKKGDANWRKWIETEEVESTMGLNWQQASLVKTRRVTREADRSTWMASASHSTIPSSSKGRKRRSKTSQATPALLPPLRFSAAPGKSAWRFVLPSPNLSRSSDLPTWCGGKRDSLVVTLGSPPSSSDTSSPPPTPVNDEQLASSDSEASLSSGSSSCSTEGQNEARPGCSSINGLVSSMLGSLSIYAGPSFSAAAPEPCKLPFPSFLSRS
jgi:hypothetical protein